MRLYQFFVTQSEPPPFGKPAQQRLARKPAQLRSTLTAIAQVLRQHTMDWRDYLAPLLFLKFVTDEWLALRSNCFSQFPAQPERIADSMAQARFALPHVKLPSITMTQIYRCEQRLPEIGAIGFDSLARRRNDMQIGHLIDLVLGALAKANPQTMGGLFEHLSFNDPVRLGNCVQRQGLWRYVLGELARLDCKHPDTRIKILQIWQQMMQDLPQPFNTPTSCLPELLARLLRPAPTAQVCDPFCGNGELLLAIRLKSAATQCYAQETDLASLALARMSMLLHGISDVSFAAGNCLWQPQFLAQNQLQQFDIQCANIVGLGLQWNGRNGHPDNWQRFERGNIPSGKPELAALCHMLAAAKPNSGRGALLLSTGCLFRSGAEQRLRHKILTENVLDAVILLPNTANQRAQTALILFDMARQPGQAVLMLDASQEHTGKRAALAEQLDLICDTHAQGLTQAGFSSWVSVAQMQANASSWLPSHYLHVLSVTQEPDLLERAKEIHTLEQNCRQTQAHLTRRLHNLLRA